MRLGNIRDVLFYSAFEGVGECHPGGRSEMLLVNNVWIFLFLFFFLWVIFTSVKISCFLV